MSDLAVQITGFVVGDDLEVRRTVTDLPAPIESAWLTFKRYPRQPDEEAILQKKITTVDVPGVGQIVVAGEPDVDGDLRFDLTPADTTVLDTRLRAYDIQIKLTTGKIYTIEKGTLQLTGDVTQTTA